MGKEVEGKSTQQQLATGIRLLAAVVFLGWLMIWVVSSTNYYSQHWQPKLDADTSSTYFGSQGTNILIYTFPILFISVLGCVYLHLVSSRQHEQSRRAYPRFTFWKRPALVKGPLGIVSWTELAFLLMFLALLVWCFAKYMANSFAEITPQSAAKYGMKVSQLKLAYSAYWLGVTGNIGCAFLFFPVTRGSSLLTLVGLTSEGSIKYHIWLGHTVMVLFTAHGVFYVVFWALTHSLSSMREWAKVGVSNVAGELALLFGIALWATTLQRVRRKLFEVFFYTHQLYALFLLFYLLHVGFSSFCLILPGVYLFLLDRFLRFLQSRQRARLASARLLPGETVELNFSKSTGLEYNPLSIVFINVPAVSKLQWHPFTVSSNSNLEPDRLSIVIKKEGRWSQKLYQLLSSPTPLDRLDVSLEGPYGPASKDFLRYESLVLVSGGSGITPFISIIREFISRTAAGKSPPPPSIRLICAFRTSADLTKLDLLLPVSSSAAAISHLRLQVDAFVTREKAPADPDPNKQLFRTVWFKPHPSDQPVSAVLGPRSWLWLGAVISASFAAFLLLLGVTNRYYIYPIDKNTNDVYSYSSKAMLNLLLICACVAGVATAAFLWNKRAASVDGRQVQNTDAPTPTTSPVSWFYNADHELESVPHQSVLQSTKVHFSGRPDLSKMLLELVGSNIGVMVSGPGGMRRSVAKVCASGLAKNLHFESTSFSW
uniref:Ferric reduction oxidase 2 n=1 Tax=Anthurium amnicola TaxID=1678845 RepID=A0A1D1YAJ4_9ARAE